MSDTIATAYVQIEPTFEGVAGKLKSGLGGDSEAAGKEAGASFGGGFASVLGGTVKVAGAALVGAVGAGSAAVTKLTSEAVNNFGQFEQLVGGVETLFGNGGATMEQYLAAAKEQGIGAAEAMEKFNQNAAAQETVLNNAANAYKTAGMDANSYMETVTSFSASLLQSVGGDTVKAAAAADTAIRDMSDNANKMGTSMESIQTAYQGFAKQNYTMLDNLKLGYGGTKSEMERLLSDASKISGIKYDISSLSDVYDAIHVVQTEMGITGTTAKEAATTLEGSFSMMSAAWQNVLTSMASGEGLSENIDALISSAESWIGNLLPVIERALGGITQMIGDLAPVIAAKIPELAATVLPMLLTAAAQIVEAFGGALQTALPALLSTGTAAINQLAQSLLTAVPTMAPMIIELVSQIGQMIIDNLPLLIESATQIILSLATGIASALPELIPSIVNVVITIAMYLIENVDLLIDAAIALITGLAQGLLNALPILIEKAPIIIGSLLTAFLSGSVKLIEAGVKLIKMVIDGLKNTVPQLLAMVPQIVTDLKNRFLQFLEPFVSIGQNIVEGIKKGISGAWDSMVAWVEGLLDGFVDSILAFFGIHSPSKLMADKVGQYIPAGIAQGIENGMNTLNKAVDDMTAEVLTGTINPSIMSNYTPTVNADAADTSGLYALLATYLPQIAAGEKVNVTLDGDAGRLFRLMQRESMRNTQLVGKNSVLAAT